MEILSFYPFFITNGWSKRKSRLMVDTERRAPATASINSAHAHLGDKLSELYHILWRNVDSVRTTVQRGRVREVLRALRGIEAHRRVKVVPANLGRWANSGSQTTISFISPFSTGDWKCRSFISQRWFSIVIANIKIFRQNDWNWKICFSTSFTLLNTALLRIFYIPLHIIRIHIHRFLFLKKLG